MRTGRRWREVTINQASTTGTPSPHSHLPIRITHIRKINLCLRQMKMGKYVWVVHKYKSTFLWVPLSCPQPIFSTPSALICHQSAALKRAVTVTIAIEKQNNLSVVLLEFEFHICPILNTENQILNTKYWIPNTNATCYLEGFECGQQSSRGVFVDPHSHQLRIS